VKELLEVVFGNLRTYVPVLAALVARPKTTIARHVAGGERDLTDALVFVGITVAIGFAFQAPLLRAGEDFTMTAGSMAALKILIIPFDAFLVWAAFRAVGGAGGYDATLSAYLYVISPLYLALVVLNAAALGLVAASNPDLPDEIRNSRTFLIDNPEQLEALADSAPSIAWGYVALFYAQLLAMLIWGIVCLGAFRRIHAVSKVRSATAYVLAFVAVSLSLFVLNFVVLGLLGSTGPSIS
jgi:hypothetical protein